jgi:acetyl esterase
MATKKLSIPVVFLRFIIKILIGLLIMVLLFVIIGFFTPWPSAMLIRKIFNRGGEQTNIALQKHVPDGIKTIPNLSYLSNDPDALLDIYYPETLDTGTRVVPLIIWIHGGGLIAGSKQDVSNYCRIIASKGFVVAAMDYSLAPGKKYPTPVRQTQEALKFLSSLATQYPIDTCRIFLAGDSGGSHIAAQSANITVSTDYAEMMKITPAIRSDQLAGVVLFCGPYDIENAASKGFGGWFMKTVLWSYSGSRNFKDAPAFASAYILNHLHPNFPPAFISAGNADPLLRDSRALSKALVALNVPVDTLFFADIRKPPLPHEYQFNLDTEAGEVAFERMLSFLRRPPERKD